MSNVVSAGMAPTKQHTYRNCNITITFDTAEKLWHWSINYTVHRQMGDFAKSYIEAFEDAKKFVDKVLDR